MFGMENDIKMIFVSKQFLIPVKYIDSKITICPSDKSTIASFTYVWSQLVIDE